MEQKTMFTDSFMPQQACEFITSVIDKKIQMCKIRFMQEWEGNHNLNLSAMDAEIDQLVQQREEALRLIRQAQMTGKKVNVDEILAFKLSA